MRTIFVIVLTILILVLGFMIGVYLYKINNIDTEIQDRDGIAENIDNEDIELESRLANTKEEKISPQCTLTIKKLYTECNHILENSEVVSVEIANLKREEFQDKYIEYEIQKFNANEIVLYKEEKDFCKQHYAIKNVNGYIGIYELDKNDSEIKLIKVTNIPTEYLTETDLIKIRKGIVVYTDKELNKMLEDFE